MVDDVINFNIKFLSTPSARRATGKMVCARFRDVPFLSTPSARRATRPASAQPPPERISIHALREEGDAVFPLLCLHDTYFYPRPPRGGRL